ncbi:MAG: MIP family channel protein [Armatimonadetes bacterium]|nr:MIP family channel protein [Armatimonadota bacterium]
MKSPLCAEMAAESVGSYILCFFGPGSVAVAVLTGEHKGLWQVASVWGFAIALAIYAVGSVSGAHLNPAVTLAMAAYRKFPPGRILPYVLAQMIGGVLAAATLLALFNATCVHFEAAHHLVRGAPGSQLSAMWFGEYFPNPAVYGTDAEAFLQVGVKTAFLAEAVGTAFLLFFIMALTDHRNDLSASKSNLHPLFIGFAVAIIISILAPLTQAGLNPMRDFAPRIVAYFAGWGPIAIPGPRGVEVWVYLLAPLVGGLVGAGAYQALIARGRVAVADGLQGEAA